ncbi:MULTISPECIES: DUF2157 domain-containing protein [unclassified Pseudomonas]|uniref:DUF2157 domain-containing protein n=1 Tax=unclassified Pseudomonas TaxID=196821 RepID=UPI002446F93E|nr:MULTISPECIES: DUF2157 domain-containing protein [unclassified Pseudomonas]MDG9924241.1 DUF2157 domain-containing protein [Pseudomonas sp. GD04045]MDH0033282.1 DUF2157 domain-containing protein [Pseudomonas sp. GD04019]
MPLTRDQAQQRADDIQAFRREAQRLRAEDALALGDEPLARIASHHDQLLAQYRSHFDIDHDQQTKRLSLSMRVVSLLGAVALAASLLFFFYQFWGLFGEALQVGVLIGFSLGSLLLTLALRQRDAFGYFAKLAGVLALACFVLNLHMLGQIFNITPSDNALLCWGAYALLLAYACNARLLLAIGLLCLLAYSGTRISEWCDWWWLDAAERPEHFLPGGLLLFMLPALRSQARFSGFAATYRGVGVLAMLLPMLVLANWGGGSYLPFGHDSIEKGYQLLGFFVSALFIWLGIRRDWAEVTLLGQLAFLLFLFIKMVDWWWDVLPKYLFFLILGLTAIMALLVLGRLRRGHKGGAV